MQGYFRLIIKNFNRESALSDSSSILSNRCLEVDQIFLDCKVRVCGEAVDGLVTLASKFDLLTRQLM